MKRTGQWGGVLMVEQCVAECSRCDTEERFERVGGEPKLPDGWRYQNVIFQKQYGWSCNTYLLCPKCEDHEV